MTPPKEYPRSHVDADDLAILLAAVAVEAGESFYFRLTGDLENWVSVEFVKGVPS
jgi:hypothetical protein